MDTMKIFESNLFFSNRHKLKQICQRRDDDVKKSSIKTKSETNSKIILQTISS